MYIHRNAEKLIYKGETNNYRQCSARLMSQGNKDQLFVSGVTISENIDTVFAYLQDIPVQIMPFV